MVPPARQAAPDRKLITILSVDAHFLISAEKKCPNAVSAECGRGCIVRIGEDMTAVAPARLDDAIRKLVADAIEDRGIIQTGTEAGRLALRYSKLGLSAREITELVVRAASAAGVSTAPCASD